MSAHDDAGEASTPANHDLNVAAGAVLVAVNAGIGAVRLALLPARILARGPLVAPFVHRQADRLAAVGDDAGTRVRERLETVPERVVEQVVADLDAGEVAGIAIDGEAAERITRQVLASPALERILLSPEGQRLLEQIAASPAVRSAVTRQSETFLDDAVAALRAAAEQADERLAVRPAEPGGRYAGVGSRGAALGVDAVIAHAVYLIGVGGVALIASMAGGLRPAWLAATLAAAAWVAIVGAYFVGFWVLIGQTPGMRLLGIRLARPVGVGRATVRFVGLLLAIAPFFAGFLSVPFDRRRRALPDYVARTEVTRDDVRAP